MAPSISACPTSSTMAAPAASGVFPSAPSASKSTNRAVKGSSSSLVHTLYHLQMTKPECIPTFLSLLKACASFGSLFHVLTAHQCIIVNFGDPVLDASLSSSLVNAYAKCGDVDSARLVFDRMPNRDVIVWSIMVGFYSLMGDVKQALSMYNEMRHKGFRPNSVTMLGLLSGVSGLDILECLHCCLVRLGHDLDLFVGNSLLNVYARCGRVDKARQLFDTMKCQDTVAWNSLISGYAAVGNLEECIQLLNRMKKIKMVPDQHTLAYMASVIAENGTIELGKLIHAHIITLGFESYEHIVTTLMNMYLKLRNVDESFELFARMTDRDVISWTAMISGLVQNDRADQAMIIFNQMLRAGVKPSSATIASGLAGCAQLDSLNGGRSLHGYITRQKMQVDTASMNSLITMYAKCRHLVQCQALFDRMAYRDVVSWNAIVSAHALNGYLNNAISLFKEMRAAQKNPDSITVVSLLQACASTGSLRQGKWIHGYLLRIGLKPSILVDTALIDMYSKCGDVEAAERCFKGMPEQDVISWSVIIAGYGNHGMGQIALKRYQEFFQTGIKPNAVLILSVLNACSHAGLVDEGLRVFQYMKKNFGIEPMLEHYACVVDLLCRAARIQEAYKFVRAMPVQPTIDILGILLDACRTHGDVELGKSIAREILMMNPMSAGNYVQLAHSYAAISKWDGVGEARQQMRSLGLKKVPGWSSIELHGTSTLFYADHTSHSQFKEIMSVMKILEIEMKERNRKNKFDSSNAHNISMGQPSTELLEEYSSYLVNAIMPSYSCIGNASMMSQHQNVLVLPHIFVHFDN